MLVSYQPVERVSRPLSSVVVPPEGVVESKAASYSSAISAPPTSENLLYRGFSIFKPKPSLVIEQLENRIAVLEAEFKKGR